jgi:GT2 family glycosyltransferase/predicted esterase
LPSDQPLDSKAPQGSTESQALTKDILLQVIIPILEKEVNEGKNFAQLRQVYSSLILAIWFKDKIKESILGKAYIDQDKVAGVDIEDKAAKEKIWAQYVEAFKKGAYNYIKEDVDPATQQTVSRKYFSGGAGLCPTREVLSKTNDNSQLPQGLSDRAMVVRASFKPFQESRFDMAMKEANDLREGILGIIEDVRRIHPRTADILSERLDLRSPDDLDALKYLKEDAQWFKDHPSVSGTYDGPGTGVAAERSDPKVSFLILHYGSTPGTTLRLLNSLARQTYKNFDVILVDNNSPDEFSKNSRKYLSAVPADMRRRIKLISNKANLGFTGGNNQAAHLAMKNGSAFVFPINNDAVLGPTALGKMVVKFNMRPDVGAMQPLFVPLGEDIAGELRGSGIVPGAVMAEQDKVRDDLLNGKGFDLGKADGKDGHLFHRVPALVGAAMMIRSEVFRLSGGFDTRLFMYKDEDDASYLLRRTGFSQVIMAESAIFHAKFDYVNKPRNQYFLWKNSFLLADKFYQRAEADKDWKVFEYNSSYRVVGPPGYGPVRGPVFSRLRQIIDGQKGLKREVTFLDIYKGVYDGIMGAFEPTREDSVIDENALIAGYVGMIRQMKTTDEVLRFLINEEAPFYSRLKIFALEKARKDMESLIFMDPQLREALMDDLEGVFHRWEAWVKSLERSSVEIQAIRDDLKHLAEIKINSVYVSNSDIFENGSLPDPAQTVLKEHIDGTFGRMEVRTRLSNTSNDALIYLHGMGGDINNEVGKLLEEVFPDKTVVRFTSSRLTMEEKVSGRWVQKLFGDNADPLARVKTFQDEEEDLRIVIQHTIEKLKERNLKDPVNLVLVGESLGGMIVPLIAHEFSEVKGIVSIVGAMRPVSEKNPVSIDKNSVVELSFANYDVWDELIRNGYINTNGIILSKFFGLKNYSSMEDLNADVRQGAYTILYQATQKGHPLVNGIPDEDDAGVLFNQFKGKTLIINATNDSKQRQASAGKCSYFAGGSFRVAEVNGFHDMNGNIKNVIRDGNGKSVRDSLEEIFKLFVDDLSKASDVGGIDLTRDKAGIQVQSAGSGVQFTFDPAMVEQLKNTSGLTPVIIDIRPMTTTVPVFLGISDYSVR